MSMNMMESVNMKKGFTLIELLVVIALLGIIAVLVTTSIVSITNSSKSSLSENEKVFSGNYLMTVGLRLFSSQELFSRIVRIEAL